MSLELHGDAFCVYQCKDTGLKFVMLGTGYQLDDAVKSKLVSVPVSSETVKPNRDLRQGDIFEIFGDYFVMLEDDHALNLMQGYILGKDKIRNHNILYYSMPVGVSND